jgi:hypothetical protein
MPVTMKFNYNQVKKMINQMNRSEKERLSEYLDEITISDWLVNFRNKMKNSPITYDEITDMVEEVRERNYENSN